MKLEELMADELEELQEFGEAGSARRTPAPRQLEFRRGELFHGRPPFQRLTVRTSASGSTDSAVPAMQLP